MRGGERGEVEREVERERGRGGEGKEQEKDRHGVGSGFAALACFAIASREPRVLRLQAEEPTVGVRLLRMLHVPGMQRKTPWTGRPPELREVRRKRDRKRARRRKERWEEGMHARDGVDGAQRAVVLETWVERQMAEKSRENEVVLVQPRERRRYNQCQNRVVPNERTRKCNEKIETGMDCERKTKAKNESVMRGPVLVHSFHGKNNGRKIGGFGKDKC